MTQPAVTLYQGDCLEILRTLESGSVDAVVTDPPYNVGLEYGSSNDRREDYRDWCESWLGAIENACGGPIVLTPGIVNVAMWCHIRAPRWIIAWHKPAAMGRSPLGFCNWEPVLLYGKTHKQSGCDVIQASIKPDRKLDGHPCPKPLAWARKLVELLTEPGMTIIDPFMGSGTTGVACVRTGRNFIGIEIDGGYFEIARKRIEAEQAKTALFERHEPPVIQQGALALA